MKGINHALTSVGYRALSRTRNVSPSMQTVLARRLRSTSPAPAAPYNEPGMKTAAAGGRARTLPWMCQRPQAASSLTDHIEDSVTSSCSSQQKVPHASQLFHPSVSLFLLLLLSFLVLPQSGSVRLSVWELILQGVAQGWPRGRFSFRSVDELHFCTFVQ